MTPGPLVTGTVGLGGVEARSTRSPTPSAHAKILIDPTSTAEAPRGAGDAVDEEGRKMSTTNRAREHVDVLIVGAGLSGIGAAHHLQDRAARARRTRSSRRATRSAAPGTCSATRASARTPTCTRSATGSGRGRARRRSPTARRSSPTSARPRASAGSTGTIRFGHRVVGAGWSTADARWTVEVERTDDGEPVEHRPALPATCAAATTATTRATRPSSPGLERFAGEVVHPQYWPEDLDYAGKRVVVIGSGATAVTLVPALAERGRARDDAAALAELRARAPERATRSPRGCGGVLPDAARATR